MKEIILASQSPRRRELLKRIVPEFRVCVSRADETLPEGLPPEECVKILALRKAQAIEEDGIIIGADTIVVCDGEILGKPADEEHAAEMLTRLSGREHTVCTGVAVLDGAKQLVACESTQVFFAELTREQIRAYIASGEPMDKAGAYGIQGLGALLVRGIAGDYHNVVGLPLFRLGQMLKECGIPIL